LVNQSITRDEVASLIAEEYAATVIETATQGSTALSAFTTVDMGTKVTNMPVLASLPKARWVNDTTNTARKPSSKVTWDNKRLVAEEIAVIIPVHENTIADATENILESIAKLGGQAIGTALDAAVFFETEKPASWLSPGLAQAAIASGNVKSVVAGAANKADIYGAGLQVAEMIADKGFDPTVAIAKRGLRFQFANLRDAQGGLVLQGENILGFDTHWNRNGAWDPAVASQIIVDPSVVRIGVRQDVTVKFLDQATIGTGDDQINLAEQDMVALRFMARFAYVLGNPITPETGQRSYGVGMVTPSA